MMVIEVFDESDEEVVVDALMSSYLRNSYERAPLLMRMLTLFVPNKQQKELKLSIPSIFLSIYLSHRHFPNHKFYLFLYLNCR